MAGWRTAGRSTSWTASRKPSSRPRDTRPRGLSSKSPLPEPPDPASLAPLLIVWKRGERLLRCHDVRFGATEFNPGIGMGRFHPLRDLDGQSVPTLYAADSLDGAFSETIFHDVPARGPEKAVRRLTLVPTVLSTLAATRDLTLAQLHGYGLSRIGLSRAELIETRSAAYGRTVTWARALHACDRRIDGLVWVSRQNDDTYALVLFGDRVDRRDLRVVEPPLPLYLGSGYQAVQGAAEKAGITIVE